MATPINSFEIVESIRFFGQIVSTEGISEDVKKLANKYMLRLMEALEPTVQEATAKGSGLVIVKD